MEVFYAKMLCCRGLLQRRIRMRDDWSLACARRHRACSCNCQQSMRGLFGFEKGKEYFSGTVRATQKNPSAGQSLKACPTKREMLCCSVYRIFPCAEIGSFLNFSLYCHLTFLFYTRKEKKGRKRKQEAIKMGKRTIKSRPAFIVKYISYKALLEALFSQLSNCSLPPVSHTRPLKRPKQPQYLFTYIRAKQRLPIHLQLAEQMSSRRSCAALPHSWRGLLQSVLLLMI